MKTFSPVLRLAILLAFLLGSAGPALSAAPARHAAAPTSAVLFEPAVLVEDINTATYAGGSGATEYTALGATAYFVANHSAWGSELWRTNGGAAGTRLVADICPGDEGNVSDLTVFDGQLYFSADDCSNGRELWTSDGTVTNTMMVRDIYPGANVGTSDIDPNSSSPESFTEFNGELYFAASDGVNGDELWKTDGTYAGTVMVKDIAPGSSSSNISAMVVFSDTLFLVADGGSSNFGEELWMSDGTEAGTTRLTDISAGSGDADLANLTVVEDLGLLFFSAEDDDLYGMELWVTDGTLAGTEMVKDIRVGPLDSFPTYLAAFGSLLLFRADNGTDTELWRTDGTEGGTVMIDIYAGGDSNPVGIAAFGSTALLAARHQDSSFMPWVWATDGYTVTKVAEINGGGGGDPEFTEVAGTIFFKAYDVDSNVEIWKTSGTYTSAEMVKDINPTVYSNPHSLFAAGSQLLFSADDGTHGSEPWRSDGTEAGTVMVADIEGSVGDSYPAHLTASGDTLFLQASDTSGSYGLWQSPDLTGAALVTDVVAAVGATPVMLGDGSSLLFQGNDGLTGTELWVTDGTPSGSSLLKDIHPSGDSYPQQFTPLGDSVYFVATDADGGEELWVTAGTEPTTQRVADIHPGSNGASVDALTVYDGQLYFFADDNLFGRELWRTDGTTTTRVSDIAADASDSTDSDSTMAVAGDTLYFTADDTGSGAFVQAQTQGAGVPAVVSVGDNVELWQYDGATVSLVEEIHLGEAAWPMHLTDVAGVLYFTADDGTHGHELWKVEAGGGAILVADIAPGAASAGIENLTAVGDRLFFTANDGTHGIELWVVADGVAALVEDIYPGTTGSLPASLVNFNNIVIFAAADPTGGYELWQSDGTPGGTARIEDLAPGPRNANPSELTIVGDRLYFSAFSLAKGYELWGLSMSLEHYAYLPLLQQP